MNEDFKFFKLKPIHKKWFIIYQLFIFLSILFMGFIAIKVTNPVIVETNEQVSLTIGAMLGAIVIALAFFNRLKNLLKIKCVAFLIIWLLLLSTQMIIDTLIWGFGLCMIPLLIDDIILIPIWKNLWYNVYER